MLNLQSKFFNIFNQNQHIPNYNPLNPIPVYHSQQQNMFSKNLLYNSINPISNINLYQHNQNIRNQQTQNNQNLNCQNNNTRINSENDFNYLRNSYGMKNNKTFNSNISSDKSLINSTGNFNNNNYNNDNLSTENTSSKSSFVNPQSAYLLNNQFNNYVGFNNSSIFFHNSYLNNNSNSFNSNILINPHVMNSNTFNNSCKNQGNFFLVLKFRS